MNSVCSLCREDLRKVDKWIFENQVSSHAFQAHQFGGQALRLATMHLAICAWSCGGTRLYQFILCTAWKGLCPAATYRCREVAVKDAVPGRYGQMSKVCNYFNTSIVIPLSMQSFEKPCSKARAEHPSQVWQAKPAICLEPRCVHRPSFTLVNHPEARSFDKILFKD